MFDILWGICTEKSAMIFSNTSFSITFFGDRVSFGIGDGSFYLGAVLDKQSS